MRPRAVLRLAGLNDMDLLFTWANEPAVRKNSFSTSVISYEEHKKWYQELQKSLDCKQYIYEYNGKAIGQVRVKVCGTVAEIGYSVCVEKRGLGHGKQMLSLIPERIKQDFPEVEILSAKVKPENVASQKVFLDINYQESYRVYELSI